jgi:hypothetical protein
VYEKLFKENQTLKKKKEDLRTSRKDDEIIGCSFKPKIAEKT